MKRAISRIETSLTRVEEPLHWYNKIEAPLHFGGSKYILTGVEQHVVGCGDDCYASNPSTTVLEGDVVATPVKVL